MPPPASHRLAILVLPLCPEADATVLDAIVARWEAGRWVANGRPGSEALVDGGFARLHVERFDDVRFASNRQGGFRVFCPRTGANIVGAFVAALTGWRGGGARALDCVCEETHDLTDLRYAPEAGFARGWIAIESAEASELAPEALTLAGDVRIVLRRG